MLINRHLLATIYHGFRQEFALVTMSLVLKGNVTSLKETVGNIVGIVGIHCHIWRPEKFNNFVTFFLVSPIIHIICHKIDELYEFLNDSSHD